MSLGCDEEIARLKAELDKWVELTDVTEDDCAEIMKARDNAIKAEGIREWYESTGWEGQCDLRRYHDKIMAYIDKLENK